MDVLATALSAGNKESGWEPEIIALTDCIQFSAFVSACNFMQSPAYQLAEWTKNFDHSATQATLHTIILLLPLEATRLAAEAGSIRYHLDISPEQQLYDQLPRVDIPEIDWQKLSQQVINVDAIKPALLHPVPDIAFLAAKILEKTPMDLQELQHLIDQASGESIRLLSILLEINHLPEVGPTLVKRFCSEPYRDQHTLLSLLNDYEVQPIDALITQLQQCLISEDTDVAISAIALLRMWHEHQQDIVVPLMEEAINHWRNLNDNADIFLFNTPLNELLRLRDSD